MASDRPLPQPDRDRLARWNDRVQRRRDAHGVTVRPHYCADDADRQARLDELADRVAVALAESPLLTDADCAALDLELRARSRAFLPLATS